MNHASGTVASLDPEPIQVGDAIGQRAQRRGWFRVRCGRRRLVEVLVLVQHDRAIKCSIHQRYLDHQHRALTSDDTMSRWTRS